jgi:6,7-dimethyl-8-ribityllumazine synthase
MNGVTRGSLDGTGLKLGIVVSRFNEDITSRLLAGALAELRALGVAEENVRTCSVPGAIEIPLAALSMARGRDLHAVVALGAVIRGETSHYDTVCGMAADGCLRATLETGLPIAFGVLTCETEEQALARSGEGESNKGREAVRVAVEMANLLRELSR